MAVKPRDYKVCPCGEVIEDILKWLSEVLTKHKTKTHILADMKWKGVQ